MPERRKGKPAARASTPAGPLSSGQGLHDRRESEPAAPAATITAGTGRTWLLMLVPVAAAAAALTLSYLWNEDFWWYLTSGRRVLAEGRIPPHDPFLYTSGPSAGWVYHSWLWTVLVALVDRLAGLGGVMVLHAVIALALCALVYTTARVDRYGLANALAVTLLLATGGHRLCGKAEIATWLLLAVFYRVLERPGPFTWRRGALLGALQVLWANLHGGWPLGAFVAACYSAGGWLERRLDRPGEPREPSRAHRPPLWLPVLLLLLALADPRMLRSRLEPFALQAGAQSVQPLSQAGEALILEWRSPLRVAATDPRKLVLLGLAAGLGLGSFAATRGHPLRARFPRLLFLLGMLALGASSVRHLPGLALAAALVGLGNLADFAAGEPLPRPAPRPAGRRPAASAARGEGPRRRWAYLAACGLVAAALLGSAVALRLARTGFEGEPPGRAFTVRPTIACPGAADFILRHRLPGPIFNDFQMGAYLTARLFPRYRLFIDSRILDPGLVAEYSQMLAAPARWQEAERRYGFRTAVLGNFSRVPRSAIGAALLADPHWRLVYLDPLATVFVRDAPAVPSALQPAAGNTGRDAARVPFLPPRGFVFPLPALQRAFLDDYPENYLIEYLSDLGQLGRPRDVVDLASRALERRPGDPLLHRQRCAAWLALGEARPAIDDCDAAYRRRPDDSQVASLYAMALARAGRRLEARGLVQEALRRNPGDPALQQLQAGLGGP